MERGELMGHSLPCPAEFSSKHTHLKLFVLFAALAALFFSSFILGRYDVPLSEVFRILINRIIPLEQSWSKSMETAIINIRLPRIILACLVGCSLSASGAAYQSVFQNPMASPDILGASSGACFGAALAILLGKSSLMITVFAFIASLVTVALVNLVGSAAKGSPVVSILLAGIMVSSLFNAGTSFIKLVADPANQLPAITYWLMGSLSGAKMKNIPMALIPMLIGYIPLLLLRWRINLLSLGDEEAETLGVNTKRLRFIVILCATLMTAASVASAGMIGWVGLVIPHLCRRYVGNDCRHLLPASMLFGAFFLLLVDNISRNLLENEIPIGILTAFVGAPFFIYLMLRKGSSL